MTETAWRTDEALPGRVRQSLGRFSDALKEALGDGLEALLLYGPVAKGDEFGPKTPVDTLLVVRDAGLVTLDAIAPALRRAHGELRLTTMVMTQKDLASSADVFPSKFIDMQEHHRVLVGSDPLAGVEISNAHLRLRCEQELKNLMLRLRTRYMRTSTTPQSLLETLGDMGNRFVDLLRNLIRLREGKAPAHRAEVVQNVEGLGVDPRLLEELLAIDRGRFSPSPTEARALAERLLVAVTHAASLADTHTESDA